MKTGAHILNLKLSESNAIGSDAHYVAWCSCGTRFHNGVRMSRSDAHNAYAAHFDAANESEQRAAEQAVQS